MLRYSIVIEKEFKIEIFIPGEEKMRMMKRVKGGGGKLKMFLNDFG